MKLGMQRWAIHLTSKNIQFLVFILFPAHSNSPHVFACLLSHCWELKPLKSHHKQGFADQTWHLSERLSRGCYHFTALALTYLWRTTRWLRWEGRGKRWFTLIQQDGCFLVICSNSLLCSPFPPSPSASQLCPSHLTISEVTGLVSTFYSCFTSSRDFWCCVLLKVYNFASLRNDWWYIFHVVY